MTEVLLCIAGNLATHWMALRDGAHIEGAAVDVVAWFGVAC